MSLPQLLGYTDNIPLRPETYAMYLETLSGSEILLIAGLSLLDTALAAVHTHEWCSGALAHGRGDCTNVLSGAHLPSSLA